MTSTNGTGVTKAWNPPSVRQVLLGLAIFAVVALAGSGIYMRAHHNRPICKDGRAPVQQKTDEMGGISYRCHNGQIVSPPL